MTDRAEHLKILGLKEGFSPEELEQAYQDRSEAWDPDNFAANDRLRLDAERKYQDIQSAYEFLRAASPQASKTGTTPAAVPARGIRGLWVVLGLLLLIVAGATWFWFSRRSLNPEPAVLPAPTNPVETTNLAPSNGETTNAPGTNSNAP